MIFRVFYLTLLLSFNVILNAQDALIVNNGLPKNFEVNRFIYSNNQLFANVGPCSDKTCDNGQGICAQGESQSGLYLFDAQTNNWSLAVANPYGTTTRPRIGSANGTGDIYQIDHQGLLQHLELDLAGKWAWNTVIDIQNTLFPGHPGGFVTNESRLFVTKNVVFGYGHVRKKQEYPEHHVLWIYNLTDGSIQSILDEGIDREYDNEPISLAASADDGTIYLGYRWYARNRANALYDELILGTDNRVQGNIFRFIPNAPFNYSSGNWESGHTGLNQGNLTNSACCGPGKEIYGSDDGKSLFYATEQGNYRYDLISGKWEQLSQESNRVTQDRQGVIFTTGGSQRLTMINGALQVQVGNDEWTGCVGSINDYQFIPGTDKKEILVATTGNCDVASSNCPTAYQKNAIWRITLDEELGSAQVSNIHPTTLTYLGGERTDNIGVGIAIAKAIGQDNPRLYVAGNFDSSSQNNLISINGAPLNSEGCVLQLSLDGQSIEQALLFGDNLYDFDMNTAGQGVVAYRREDEYYIAKFDVMDPGSASIFEITVEAEPERAFKVSIGDSGEVGVLAYKSLYYIGPTGEKIKTSLETNKPTSIFPSFVRDVAVSEEHKQIYVTGFDNKECDGVPVQVAFIIAYDLNLSYRWHTYGFNGQDMCGQNGNDMADTRGYLLDVGEDGKLYFAGESAGGNTTFRWDGTYTDITGTNKETTLVEIDEYTKATNTKSNHISYLALIDHGSGKVVQGQLILSRRSNKEGNTYRVRNGSLFVDIDGNSYLGGSSAAVFGGRGSIRLGGKFLGPYGSGPNNVHDGTYLLGGEVGFGDAVLCGVNGNFDKRLLWLGFTRNQGENLYAGGTIVGIASAYGSTAVLTVGSGHHWTTENALLKEPLTPFDGNHNDTYLGVWASDLTLNANNDELEQQLLDGGFLDALPDNEPGVAEPDPCYPPQDAGFKEYDDTDELWREADCDGDGITNGAEHDNGTDPYLFDAPDNRPDEDEEDIPNLIVATALTPNGDGVNDTWVIQGILEYPEAHVQVYNRWGHKIFSEKGYQNDWEGIFESDGKRVPPGSYFYVIDFNGVKNDMFGGVFINY